MGNVLSSIREGASDKILDGIKGLDASKKKLLDDEVDAYTIIVGAKIPSDILDGESSKPFDDSFLKSEEVDLGWDKYFISGEWYKSPPTSEELVLQSGKAKLSIPMLLEDDFKGTPNITTLEILKNPIILPLEDKHYLLESDEAAETLLDQMRLLPKEGQANPIPYHTWDEMSSDEAISRIFFYGIGSVLMHIQSATTHTHVKEELGPFVVDMDLSNLEVRPGYSRYGSRLHFDVDQNVTAIYDYASEKLIKPGEGQAWEKAKHIAKQTAFTLITAREHLLWTHLLLANTMTRVKSQELPPNHPLRRLLTVFTFRTNYVNARAYKALVPELSMIHRGSAFTAESINKLFVKGYTQSNIFQPFPQQPIGDDLKKLSDEGTFPYHAEGVAWFDVVRSFVCEWIDKAGEEACLQDQYAKKFFRGLEAATKGQQYVIPSLDDDRDAKIDVLTQMIWVVTAYHEIVGTIVDYTRLPSFMGLRALDDASNTTTDMQSFLLMSVLTASTALKMPMLVGKFDNFFGKGGAPAWEIEVWSNFQDAIHEQSKKVNAADQERKIEFKIFDPVRFECAVSV